MSFRPLVIVAALGTALCIACEPAPLVNGYEDDVLAAGEPCTPDDTCVEGTVCDVRDGICVEGHESTCPDLAESPDGEVPVCVELERRGRKVSLDYTIK